MKAIVVYESHWGNTAAIARAIAEGLGPSAQVLSTSEASGEALAEVGLIVAGAPLMGFSLPTEEMIKSLAGSQYRKPTPPDLTHPSMRAWLESLPHGSACSASFETRIWWSPGSAAKTILGELEKLGYRPVAEPGRFIVKDKYGPLKDGELERARQWGAELSKMITSE